MKEWINRIHHGDRLDAMRRIPPESADLSVPQPP